MTGRRITAIAITGALVACGSGAAVAAISKGDDKKAEQAVLDNAAKRLSVTPQALRDALAAAQDDQLDQAVKDGLMTQKQADAIKARRKQNGRVLGGPFDRPGLHGFGPGGPHGPGLGAHKGGHMLFEDLAKSLDLTPAKLFAQLRAGKSIADVAKAQGKSLDDVRAAIKSTAKTRADQAVKDGDITQAQADELLSHLDDALKNLDKARPLLGRRGFHGDFGKRPPRLRGGEPNDLPGSFGPAPSPEGFFG